jgi:alpha-1,6-mannosyltransferase
MSTPSPRLWIHGLGAIIFALHLALALLSYIQAPVLWNANAHPRAAAFFAHMGFSTSRLIIDTAAVIVSHSILLAIASLAAMVLVLMLTRHGAAEAGLPRLLLRWSIAFAAAQFLAFPLFTQDFWLSAAWGRMVVTGINPYHALFTDAHLSGLPLDHFPMTMSYGPVWAVISAAIALVAWNNALVLALLFKAVIAAAWIAALLLIDRAQGHRPALDRCLALALFGWVPLSGSQSIAEGHNDIVMIAPALLWFVLLARNHGAAPIALATAVLCKYATAPLFLIDLIDALRRQHLTLMQYAWRMLPAALIGLVLTALFFRSLSFFDGLRLVSEWFFLRPADAVTGLEQILGLSLYPLPLVAQGLFPVVAVYWLASAARDANAENLAKATVALIAAILFGALSHLWPWYLVWGIAFAALLPRWWMSRFITGVALLIPFALASWWIESIEPMRNVITLAIYAGAGLWVYLTRERPNLA